MIIEIENVIHSKVDKPVVKKILPALSIQFKKTRYDAWKRKTIHFDHTEKLIHSSGIFLTGYIPRLKKYLNDNQIPFELINRAERLKADQEPNLKNIILRDDQKNLIHAAIKRQRGILIAPTGSGKTVLAGAIISCFKNKKTLFLCDKKSLAHQAVSDFKEYGLKNISLVGDNTKDISGDIVVAIQKSLIKFDFKKIATLFDTIILDEAHHCVDKNSQHGQILYNLLAPIRIGLTATYPNNPYSQIIMEGLLGPVIGELTEQEALDSNIIVHTKVIIRKVEFDPSMMDVKNARQARQEGIVKNQAYNRQILKEVKTWNDEGKSVLIFFVETDHGKHLKHLADEMNIDMKLLYGETHSDIRESVKADFKTKKVMCVASSTIWKEGINIPSLDVVINAAGGKSDIAIRQLKGRGTRKYEGKEVLYYIDFFNPNHSSFINAFGFRISLYFELGWM